MHIKRFIGNTIENALGDVKKEFGEDAILLSTRKVGNASEVIAAIDFDVDEIVNTLGSNDEFKRGLGGIQDEINELRTLFSNVAVSTVKKDLIKIGRGAVKVYDELTSRGVNEKLSHKLIRAAALATSDGDLSLKENCLKIIRERTDVVNPLKGRGGPKLIAFVGSTGVGKTTTISKLAAGLGRKRGVDVGIISIDNRRTGSAEAIRQCGRKFDIDVATPENRSDFNRALWKGRSKDVILIDTPGINPRETKSIAGLKQMLGGGMPIKLALVLSVTSRDESQMDACRGFGKMPLDCLVYTRIDEARNFGTILNTAAMVKKPIAYLCDGQRIPGDIGAASGESIGNLVLR